MHEAHQTRGKDRIHTKRSREFGGSREGGRIAVVKHEDPLRSSPELSGEVQTFTSPSLPSGRILCEPGEGHPAPLERRCLEHPPISHLGGLPTHLSPEKGTAVRLFLQEGSCLSERISLDSLPSSSCRPGKE